MPKIRRIRTEKRAPSDFAIASDTTYSHTRSGVTVDEESAMNVPAVYGCVRTLTDAVSTLPHDSMIRRDGIPSPYRPRPAWLDFNRGAWNKIDILSQIMMSLLLQGNAYVLTPRLEGETIYLQPIDPRHVTVERIQGSDRVRYYVSNPWNGQAGWLDEYAVKHIPAMMRPGDIVGCTPIQWARETIGMSLAAERYGAAFYGNGARPGTVATLDPSVDYEPTAVQAVVDEINRRHKGVDNAHKVMALTKGMTLDTLSMNHNDAEFLATRRFNVPQIAMMFGVPVHLLGVGESNQFGTSIEQQNIAFAQFSLRPWVERIEAALTDIMRLDGHPDRAYVSLNMQSYQRGDHGSWVESNMKEITQGSLTINEHRAQFGRPPVTWGDRPISVQVDQQPAEAHAEILDSGMPQQIEGAQQ